MDPVRPEVDAALAEAHRREWGFVLAATARLVGGDVGLAEDATAEAFADAVASWPRNGVPRNPGAWLTTAARRRAIDLVRRDATLRRKLPLLAGPEAAEPPYADDAEADVIPDDRLRLVFTCCHPALAPEARVALTLRLVCGLTTAEIARAFLVPEPTMAARITRAKKKIAAAGIPYRVPSDADLAPRLDSALTVVHLVFTAGHAPAAGDDPVRADLVARALDLGRVLAVLLPAEPEVLGLLALMELTDARRTARTDGAGRLVLLEDQDRSRWDADEIERGLSHLDRALALVQGGRPAGRFVLQAAVAGVHAEAATFEDTDWGAVVALYDRLGEVWPNPVVAVNRAAALAFARGAGEGLAALEALAADPRLVGYHYLPAARADLLRRLGRDEEAATAYRAALALDPAPAERDFLLGRLAEVTGTPPPPRAPG
ncbi:MAG: DUF6596 domain-containing protein [Candidatus Nanopelagicales bacterium]